MLICNIKNLAIVWYHNNKALIHGEKFRIITNEIKSTLTIKCVQREDFGYYVCKAINDAGDVTTRGKLIESSAFMTSEEVEKKKEKSEKRLAKKGKSSKRSSKTEVKSSSSVNVEATVTSQKRTSSSSKTIGESNVDASASFKTKKIVGTKVDRKIEESSELTITKNKEVYIQETEETYITEIEKKTCHTVITINNIHDLENIKSSKDISDIMTKLKSSDFGNETEAVKELVTINYMLQNGLNSVEIQKLLELKYFPTLLNTSTQSALVQLLEREGHEKFVAEILSEKDEKEIDENFLATVGFRAFLNMIETHKEAAKDIILLLKPEDFTSANWKNQSSEV